jgi:dTDP-glucose 4,6-dehydratase
VKVLLAGGAGFIGSHVADALLGRGDEVVAVDNLCTGRASNVAHLENHPKFTLVEHDITMPFPQHIVFDDGFDAVMNLASPASPNDFATMPLEILSVGSTGTRALLDMARSHQARFLLASTSEVYGDPLVHPQPESYWGNVSPVGPRSCYDEAKRFSEALTVAYANQFDVDIRIVRIFNTYGERMRPGDGRVVNTFVEQALSGRPITLHGDGRQSRSFCHVSDEVRGIVALLDSNVKEPMNIGNPNEFTMEKLAELVLSITGSKSEVIRVPLPSEREGDPKQRCPDITFARDTLGWEPSVSLSEGLSRMVHYFRTYEGFA